MGDLSHKRDFTQAQPRSGSRQPGAEAARGQAFPEGSLLCAVAPAAHTASLASPHLRGWEWALQHWRSEREGTGSRWPMVTARTNPRSLGAASRSVRRRGGI